MTISNTVYNNVVKSERRINRPIIVLIGICFVVLISVGLWVLRSHVQKQRVIQNYLAQNAHIGRLLKNDVEKGDYLSVDSNRLSRASEILSNNKFDHGAIFLLALVAYYPGYGNVLQIEFVDELSDIVQINYVGSDANADSVTCLMKIPPGEFNGMRYYGTFRAEIVPCIEGGTIPTNLPADFPIKPHYVFLLRSIYENIIEARGEIQLIDRNGKILDSLPLRKRPVRQE